MKPKKDPEEEDFSNKRSRTVKLSERQQTRLNRVYLALQNDDDVAHLHLNVRTADRQAMELGIQALEKKYGLGRFAPGESADGAPSD